MFYYPIIIFFVWNDIVNIYSNLQFILFVDYVFCAKDKSSYMTP